MQAAILHLLLCILVDHDFLHLLLTHICGSIFGAEKNWEISIAHEREKYTSKSITGSQENKKKRHKQRSSLTSLNFG
jgi:membrane protein YqaA with SNARE-associated domain